ncbi:uncharacterized protein LOC105280395 isoform X2 [Ooceraea biroi]|uniref:Uncharacterized protein n=1 Tax=Ooceraea biroi TaxID=2015173 RepID=A0A026WDP3_OOCBI|nr:uncharacterized protein LOC105280395 isoform X2 [Ooceraea biroi]EZA54172.1 hypothetical protein X777_06022 [Ooceraea biroi]
MHIWIHKPAGRYYGFAGRRYPPAPVPKTRSNRCRRCSERRQMVTSVHRIQGLGGNFATGNASSAGPSNSRRNVIRSTASVRSHNSNNNNNNNENRHHGSSSLNAAQLAQLNNIPNNVTDVSNNQLILSNATSTNSSNRGCQFLGFSEFSDADLAGYRLRCGIWITFILVTTFVAIAKFYFGYREPGPELFVFCGLLTLLLLGCLYSIFCNGQERLRDSQNHQDDGDRSEHSARMQEDHIVALTSASSVSESVVGRAAATVPTTTVRQNPPPPPYHIAILIPPPPPTSSDEAPPPSYDKIMR